MSILRIRISQGRMCAAADAGRGAALGHKQRLLMQMPYIGGVGGVSADQPSPRPLTTYQIGR